MNLIRQPDKSKLCGQCTVAMLSGKTVDEVVAFMGDGKTFPRDPRRAAAHFGVKLARRSVPFDGTGPVGQCGAVVVWADLGHGEAIAHWIAWSGSQIFDPAAGVLDKPRDGWRCGIYLVEAA